MSFAFIKDPRWYQILSLGTFLFFGIFFLAFDITLEKVFVHLCGVLVVQYICQKMILELPFEPKSALITGLSLCLLFRTDSLYWNLLVCVLAISSKFVFRFRGKHIFNPANFGIAVLLLATDKVWISPGQWGSSTIFAFLLVSFGGMVLYNAKRMDTTLFFLFFFASFVFLRAFYLGDPLTIPLYRLQSGALILFSFFMISDPKATPDSRLARILFTFLTAALAWYFIYRKFNPNGLIYSLILTSCLIPFLDAILQNKKYEWIHQEV